MTDKPKVTAEAISYTRGHLFAEDQEFMVRLSGKLDSLHFTAPLAERLEVLNQLTAARVVQLDKEDLDTAREEATRAERKRIGDILTLDEANGREASARHLALTTDFTAEQAKGTLASMPKAGALTAEQIAYAERMSRGPRSRDAPGGLVTAEVDEHPTGGVADHMASAFAVVRADPTDLVSARTDRKAMWSEITRKLSGGATSA